MKGFERTLFELLLTSANFVPSGNYYVDEKSGNWCKTIDDYKHLECVSGDCRTIRYRDNFTFVDTLHRGVILHDMCFFGNMINTNLFEEMLQKTHVQIGNVFEPQGNNPLKITVCDEYYAIKKIAVSNCNTNIAPKFLYHYTATVVDDKNYYYDNVIEMPYKIVDAKTYQEAKSAIFDYIDSDNFTQHCVIHLDSLSLLHVQD